MPTIYQRLNAFYKIDKFRFKERDKKNIGMRISALWKELHRGEPEPPKVQSQEDSGIYVVFDYPEPFTTMIDQLIRNVHQEILSASIERRRLQEASGHSTSAPPPSSPTPLAPLPKLRKRVPIKQTPAWKGK